MTTLETRAIRDLKRLRSWKVYGLQFSPSNVRQVHYVRLSFLSDSNDAAFERLAELLMGITARRHLSLKDVRPFGIGSNVANGTPPERKRVYAITHCAKQTPAFRGVGVVCEMMDAGKWRRMERTIDRLGLATYKSVDQGAVWREASEQLQFMDDPWLRFARLTLRFGRASERVHMDIDGDKKSIFLKHGRSESCVTLSSVRVWTSTRVELERPVRTAVRLIFCRKNGAKLSGSSGRIVAEEAEKFVELIPKALAVAGGNSLAIPCSVGDDDVFVAALRGVSSQRGYVVASADSCARVDISKMFVDSELFAYRSPKGGLVLITQSRSGKRILRQHLEKSGGILAAITPNGFGSSSLSTLTRTDGQSGIGAGVLYYNFKRRNSDGERFAEWITQVVSEPRSEPPTAGETAPPEKLGVIRKIKSNVSLGGTKMQRRLGAEKDVQDGVSFTHSRSCSNTSASSTSSADSFLKLISGWNSKFAKREVA